MTDTPEKKTCKLRIYCTKCSNVNELDFQGTEDKKAYGVCKDCFTKEREEEEKESKSSE